MIKLSSILIAALIVASTTAIAQDNIQSIDIGSIIPDADYGMVHSRGKGIVTLNSVKTDKGLLVMFSCNTCPYVIKSQERTKEMMAYAKEKGIGMIIVNSNEAKRAGDDNIEAMDKYAKKQGYYKYGVPYVSDANSQLADAFGATRTPEVFLFNGDGVLMYKGAMEDNPRNPEESKEIYLKDAIDKVTAGEAPDPNSTKSIGCSIKRVS